jgi:hypothetical protein
VVGRQIGAKPTAFAGVATRKGRSYGKTFFPKIETKMGQKKILSIKLFMLNQF